MIRVKLLPAEGEEHRLYDLISIKDYFEKYGMLIVENDFDVLLFAGHRLSETELPPAPDLKLDSILKYRKPIIILERWDSAKIATESKYLEDPAIKAIFKKAILRPIDLNNYYANIRHHYGIIREMMCEDTPERLDSSKFYPAEVLKKARCVPWELQTSFFHPLFQSMKETAIDFEGPRPFDVFFAGRARIYHDEYRWHRQKAIDVIASLTDLRTIAVGTAHPSIDTERLPPDQYYEMTQMSKIVVSPWGLGEYCHRDVEAMLLGAVVIKPDTSFVETLPHIYQNDMTYVPCRPDFSDLEEKIRLVLDDYSSYKKMRLRARDLLNSWDYDKYAKYFVSEVKCAIASCI